MLNCSTKCRAIRARAVGAQALSPWSQELCPQMMCPAYFVLTLMTHTLALLQVGSCNVEQLSQGVLWFCGFTLQPWLGLWDPVVYGEDLVMAA